MKKTVIIILLLAIFSAVIYFLFIDYKPSLTYYSARRLERVGNTIPDDIVLEEIESGAATYPALEIIDSLAKSEEQMIPKSTLSATPKSQNTNQLFSNLLRSSINKDSIDIMTRAIDFGTPGSVSVVSFKGYKAGINLKAKDVAEALYKNGMTKATAQKASVKITSVIGKQVFKRVTIFTSATSAVIAVQSLFRTGASLAWRIGGAIVIGLILVALYIIAYKKGYMR